MWRWARLRSGCDDGGDDATIAQSLQPSDCGRYGATIVDWHSRVGPTGSARQPSWGGVPAGVMWSRILARVLEDWLRQDRPDGISDGYCDLLGCVQRLLRAPTKTLIHSAAVGRAFSWVALSAGAQWVGAVDDDGCRGDSGAQLLLEQQSVVVRLLVLEVSTVSEDALLSLCSLRAFSWVALSAGATLHESMDLQMGAGSLGPGAPLKVAFVRGGGGW